MWNQYFEPNSIEERRSLRAPDAAQLILTLFLLIGSGLILRYYSACSQGGTNWLYFMFFGCIFWLAYLMTSLVGQYKSRALRFFFKLLDYAFYLFHLIMFIWALTLVGRGDVQSSACSDAGNFFNQIYILIGWFLIGILVIGLLAALFSKIRPKDQINASLGGDQILSGQGYGDASNFNPYGA